MSPASMRFLAMLCCLGLFAGYPAQAAPPTVAGVRLDDQATVASHRLHLNGAGLRRILFMKVYVAALYLPDRVHDAHAILARDMPRRLQLTLLRDLSTEQNVDAMKGGLVANNSPAELQKIQPEVERFLAYIRGLHEVPAGTVIHLDYASGQGTRVSVNGRLLGTVPGDAFNRALMGIWLGDDPVQTNLKQALLGSG